mgnify:FL=1
MELEEHIKGVRLAAKSVSNKAGEIILKRALLTETEIKRNSTSRPGPISRSGEHRRAWTTTAFAKRGEVGAVIGNTVPYAMRLEFGFAGTDSLGRVYNQPPYPAAGPAMQLAQPLLKKELLDGLGIEPVGTIG